MRPSALSFLTKCVKKEPEVEEDNEDDEEEEVFITEVTQKTEAKTIKYLPKTVAGFENLVVVPVTKAKGSGKRMSKGGPVPKGR